MKAIPLGEFMDLPPKPSKPYTSSPWDFNEQTLTLDLYETTPEGGKYLIYQVDLERCTTPAQVLDWIVDNTIDVWEDDTRLASLVRDLFLYLGSKVCFGNGVTDIKAIVKANIASANILRGRRSRSTSHKHQENPASS
ncbi:MAG: hypothetical protein KF747_08945 [Nitrospira sp.]|nr:hypothetical protein [Nitrospira sp.]